MPNFLHQRLEAVRSKGLYRKLPGSVRGGDFWSNDYLGLARLPRDTDLSDPQASTFFDQHGLPAAATGSRLISGDRDSYHRVEKRIAAFHGFPTALVYNSGYSALVGLLSTLLTRHDTIIYDELSHASCRDGIRLGQGRSHRFVHNQTLHLRQRLKRARATGNPGQLFVLTEGRFSMDGDLAPLREIVEICEAAGAHLIVDEAHSGGLEGGGRGLVAELGLQARTFATIITYGKAFGAHGAAVLGRQDLRDYLINTSRPFIYTTGMPAAQWAGIDNAYRLLNNHHEHLFNQLDEGVRYFRAAAEAIGLGGSLADVHGPIQVLQLPGNEAVVAVEKACREAELLVKAIRSPTVAPGAERIRICLHAFNTRKEIDQLVTTLHAAVRTFAV